MPCCWQWGFVDVDHQYDTPTRLEGIHVDKIFKSAWNFSVGATEQGELVIWGTASSVASESIVNEEETRQDKRFDIRHSIIEGNIIDASFGFEKGIVVRELEDGVHTQLIEPVKFDHGLPYSSTHLVPQHCDKPTNLSLFFRDLTLPGSARGGVKSVAAGQDFYLILTEDGRVYGCGDNAYGQLGHQTFDRSDDVLREIPCGKIRFRSIACGVKHCLAICDRGECWSWGCSLHGQCGSMISTAVTTPTRVEGLAMLKISSIDGGMFHSICCTDIGDVYTWGSNQDGALGLDGHGGSRPQLVECFGVDDEQTFVIQVAAGARHSLVLCKNGDVYTFGYGAFGQLGYNVDTVCSRQGCNAVSMGSLSERSQSTPNRVVAGKGKDVQAGWWHSLLLEK